MIKVAHGFGRQGFGDSPKTYAAVRPEYPDALYECLAERCGLKPGCTILEVGPGTGLATTRLLAHLPSSLLALEPDERLAAHLRNASPQQSLKIEQATLERSVLPADGFDLGVAATSFHWIDQRTGLAKIHNALRPGGWWAMWWTHFGAGTTDRFQAATAHLFGATGSHQADRDRRRIPFDLAVSARLHDLRQSGLIGSEAHAWQATHSYDTERLVDLYATFSTIRALPTTRRSHFLAEIARIANDRFGGRIDRTFTTSLYIAQRPT